MKYVNKEFEIIYNPETAQIEFKGNIDDNFKEYFISIYEWYSDDSPTINPFLNMANDAIEIYGGEVQGESTKSRIY